MDVNCLKIQGKTLDLNPVSMKYFENQLLPFNRVERILMPDGLVLISVG